MSLDRYGDGTVFRLKGRTKWRAQLIVNGKRHIAHAPDERAAKRKLQDMRREAARGQLPDVPARRAKFEDAVELLKADYAAKENRSLDRALMAVAHLNERFARTLIQNIGYEQVAHYIAERLAGEKGNDGTWLRRPASHGTVACERAILGRMLTLAVRARFITVRPQLPGVGGPDRARTGFFETAQAEAVFAHLPEPLDQLMRFCFLTGWRTGAARSLEWRNVDFHAGVVRLDPQQSKNKSPVVFPFRALPQLDALLRERRDATRAVERTSGCVCRRVFHRNGRPIKDYRGAWQIACRAAGVPGRIPHDFRRTAARNLVRSGVPERVAMQLLGHKTRAIFDRYAIVSEGDLNAAAARLATQLEADASTPSRATDPTADLVFAADLKATGQD